MIGFAELKGNRRAGPVTGDDVAFTFRERWEDPAPLDHRTPVRALLHRAAKQPTEPSALPPEDPVIGSPDALVQRIGEFAAWPAPVVGQRDW